MDSQSSKVLFLFVVVTIYGVDLCDDDIAVQLGRFQTGSKEAHPAVGKRLLRFRRW